MADSHPSTFVLGLGNPILTDGGVGIRAARAVAACLGSQADLADDDGFAEASVGGLRLRRLLNEDERVILVDVIQSTNGWPGDICWRLPGASLAGASAIGSGPPPSLDLNGSSTMYAGSTHDLSLEGTLAWGRQNGMALPADDDILIVA